MGNQLGVPITLQNDAEKFALEDRLALKRRALLFPNCVKLVGENLLPCATTLRSGSGVDSAVMVQPGEVLCVPLAFMDSPDVVIGLVPLDGGNASSEEPLGELSPRGLLLVAESRGVDSIGRLKEFTFKTSSAAATTEETAYVDVTYHLQGSVLTMILAPSRPTIHNGTRFPLKVFLFLGGHPVEEATVNPEETFVTLKNDPFGPQLQYLFQCDVHGALYTADERVDLNSIDPEVGEIIVLKHEEYPRRCFFELSIERRPCDVGGTTLVYSVLPRYIFGVENNSLIDVEITSESGDSVGTLGVGVLSSTPLSNFAYLPLNTQMVRSVGMTKSAAFEIGESLEERLVMCGPVDRDETDGLSHCFLLRARTGDAKGVMELLPALFLVNMDPTRSLFVRHTIKSSNGTIGSTERVHRVVVPSSGMLSHTTLSRYGYTDFFAFAWEDGADDCAYSSPVEATLSPGTDWTGFVQCGHTHHAVQIRKGGACDAAVLAVSAPRRPYLKLVNLTPYAYDALGPMSISSCTPPSVNNEEVILCSGGNETRVQLSRNLCADVGRGVMAFVKNQRDAATVVLSLAPLNTVTLAEANGPSALAPRINDENEDAVLKEKALVRVDIKASQSSLSIRDGGELPLHVTLESSEFWLVYQTMKVTAQCTVSNVCIQGTYKEKKNNVVKPFSFNMSVHDVEIGANTINVLSTQLNLTQLELEVSDVLLYQLQQLSKHCRPHQPNLGEPNTSMAPFPVAHLPMFKNKRMQLVSVAVFEVSVVITYDRSVSPPEDVLFRGSPIGSLIPSLHRASMRLPTVRLRDVSGASALEVGNIVREVLFIEIVKQIPNLVTSVVLFPSLSPLGSMLSRVGSFIFGSRGSSSDLPGTTLI
ncbi:hypothetical protein DQ04_02801050 [Trypanosoma grayi]|uniref:hypothetical protein n=1 Tax=Trypanosoma grayi TaxID=71804 RepID=UPI0004F41E2A|nr:hypothetical protein DQ04_02801050 [Trypanosoma grayi]KEG11264.1 hypothetical protein DQ04_02801050 [Trypanosoma grayi]